jgi:hypothetical protein
VSRLLAPTLYTRLLHFPPNSPPPSSLQLANLELRRVVVSDNHEGVSLNFVRSTSGTSLVTGSLVMGSTAVSADCGQSTACRAMSSLDTAGLTCRSVYGLEWRRVGITSAQYTGLAKTCGVNGELQVCRPVTTPERMCGMPWEKRYGLPDAVSHAELFISNTVFAHFPDPSDCGKRSAILVLNPSQVDFNPPFTLSAIAFHNVHDGGFEGGGGGWVVGAVCVEPRSQEAGGCLLFVALFESIKTLAFRRGTSCVYTTVGGRGG